MLTANVPSGNTPFKRELRSLTSKNRPIAAIPLSSATPIQTQPFMRPPARDARGLFQSRSPDSQR